MTVKKPPEGLLFSRRDVIRIILPLVAEQFLAMFVGMADSVMVAGVGEAAVSAVSLVDSINVLLINLFTALATGGAVVAGQYLGAQNEKKARRVTDQLVLLIFLISLVVTAALFFLRNFLLRTVFGSITEEVMGYAQTYFTITLFSIPFIALYNGGAAIFRTMADSRTPMLISFLMNAVNIGGNALLIFGFKMEIAGAAIPTLISRVVAAAVVLGLLCRERYTLRFSRPFSLKLELHTVGRILGIGIPNGIENGMFQFGKIMVVSLISSFGTVAITANAVGNAISVFQILPGFAIGTACVPIVSRCFGAGESRQIRYYTSRLLGLTFVFNILINVVLSLAIPLILQLYQLSEDTMGLTTWVLLFSAVVSSTIWPPAFMLPNAFRATGDVTYTMIVSVASMWIFRVGLSYVLGGYLGLGLQGVWYGMAADWLFRGICFVARYFSKSWRKRISPQQVAEKTV